MRYLEVKEDYASPFQKIFQEHLFWHKVHLLFVNRNYCFHFVEITASIEIITSIYCFYVYFFSVRFLNMCKPITTFQLLWWADPSRFVFYGSWPASLLSWLEIVNAGWLRSMRSEISLKIDHFSRLLHQTGCVFTWAACSI